MSKVVVVVGVGALGSHVVQFLRNLDVVIRVIDFDSVEQKNVLSQFHGKPGVGKGKVLALQQTMKYLFGTKIDTIPHKLIGANVRSLLANADLVIDCLDNQEARKLVQDMVRFLQGPAGGSSGITCLHGALAADGQYGRVVWDHAFKIDSEAGIGAATCEGGEHLPFIGIVSAYLARAVQIYLTTSQKFGFEINPVGAFRT